MFNILSHSYPLWDKVLFYESISNLLEWWVTLLAWLKWLADRLDNGAFRDVVENTIFFLESGDALNVAMRKIPGFYGDKEIAIIESGEQTWMMSITFAAIAKELRMQEDLRRKIVWALAYPFIIFGFLILAIIVVMIYVIPQIMPMIFEMTTDIPWSTRSLIAISDFTENNIWYIVLFSCAMGLFFYGYVSTISGKKWLDTSKIKFPLIGKVYKNYMIVQVMDTFALLMSSWVSILKSLKLTWVSSWNAIVTLMFESIARDVSAGKKIAESFKEADPYRILFTSDIIQMIESAERTSTLDSTARKIGEQYRREVDSSLAIMVKFIEPIALLWAWVFVLWFAVAIFSAIMQVVAVSWM